MSSRVKAIKMAFDAIERKRNGEPAPMATCPNCGEPLIATFRFAGYEFVCVVCKRMWGFIDPKPAEATPELEARQKELRAQFDAEIAQANETGNGDERSETE